MLVNTRQISVRYEDNPIILMSALLSTRPRTAAVWKNSSAVGVVGWVERGRYEPIYVYTFPVSLSEHCCFSAPATAVSATICLANIGDQVV
jgi:hypothetical protein